MEIVFDDENLEDLAENENAKSRLPASVIASFRRLMVTLIAAEDERTIRERKALHFEKLKGNRSHQYSLRLNRQFRLIIEIELSEPKNILHLIAIEDYH